MATTINNKLSAHHRCYQKFKLSCLNAPNVIAKKIIIPGQVDYEWVEEKVRKWCVPKFYRTSSLFSNGDGTH